jgi:hypothetical protein
MDKEILDIRVVYLLEQIQQVDKLIQLYVSKKHDVIAMSMLKQYTIRREEFVEQLNEVFNLFSLQLNSLESINGSKKSYASERLTYSFANEPISGYQTKEGLTDIEEN